MGERRREFSAGEWPWYHASETWYNEDGTLDYMHSWDSNGKSWEYTRNYTQVDGKTRCKSAQMQGTGPYKISFEYYPNATVKTATFSSTHGNVTLHYSEDGKLETLEKEVNGKKTTCHYTYDANAQPLHIFTADGLYNMYKKDYIDSTGGFGNFDEISSAENFGKYKEQYGINIETSDSKQKKSTGRAPTKEELAIALALLESKTPNDDARVIYDRLEKTSSKNHQIGLDAVVLDNGLVAISKMYHHTAWERGDASWTIRGGGEEWTYELDGAIVDVSKKEVISKVNFSRVVRDSYDGSKDIYNQINPEKMLKVDGNTVEFIMGDKYHTVASRTIDSSIALVTHQAKKNIAQKTQNKDEETPATATTTPATNTTSSKSKGYGSR